MIETSTRKSKLAFRLSRFLRFLKLLVSKKKSAFGLAIIFVFFITAAGAPLMTPYTALGEDPSSPLFPIGTNTASPVWLRYFPTWLGGDPTLSEQMNIVKNPGLPKLTSEGGDWSIDVEGSGVSDPSIRTDVGYPLPAPPGFKEFTQNGSLQIRFSRTKGPFYNGTKIHIYTVFDYPYTGPPGRFIGNIALLVNGSTHEVEKLVKKAVNGSLTFVMENVTCLDVPIVVRIYLGQQGGKEWKVWPCPYVDALNLYPPLGFATDPVTRQPWGIDKPESGILAPGGWIIARNSAATKGGHIDSDSNSLVNEFTEFGEESAPHRLVFTNQTTYIYGIEITFLDQEDSTKDVSTEVFIDDFGLRLYGTSFGLMGTDHHGRDLFSQLVYGTRISLYLGFTVSIFSVVIGLSVGLAAGYLGKAVDEILMRIADVLLVLPGLPLLIVLTAVLGATIENLILLLGVLGWMGFSRMVRSQVISIKERPFVEAAKAVGAGRFHIIINHILPSVASLVYISLATAVPGAVTAEAALAWLGFFDPVRMSWGRMLHANFEANALTSWWWVIPPGLCISLLSVSFIMLGFALDEILNPKLRLRK